MGTGAPTPKTGSWTELSVGGVYVVIGRGLRCHWAGFTLSLGGVTLPLGGVYVVIDVVPETWSKEQVATGFW